MMYHHLPVHSLFLFIKSHWRGNTTKVCLLIRVYGKYGLTHVSLASFLWDIGKLCRPRSDDNAASDQGLHCLLTECSNKFEKKQKKRLTPLNWKWARPSDKGRKFHSASMG